MNAANNATQQARSYWQERGIALDGFTLAARQAPLAGSVWWVEACSPTARYDLLVIRLGKQAFRYVPHCPWGYTLYACHKSGETPLEVVEYEAQAQERIEALRQTQRYAAIPLCYLANPSAAWRDAVKQALAASTQQQEESHQQRVEAYRAARYETHSAPTGAPQSWPLPPLSHNDLLVAGKTQALLTSVFALLTGAFAQQGITCTSATQRTIRAFLAGRIKAERCQPWGCMWTVKRCLLFVPGDAASRYELKCWVSWKWGQAYCLWFDGLCLRECTYEELQQLLEGEQPLADA